jgi:VWFA-related protein
VVIDAVLVDGQGRPVTGAGPGDFNVTIDGRSRTVLSVAHVFRGPGAAAAADAARAALPPGATASAEPSRTVLIAIDEASIGRGEESSAVTVAARLIDRFGPDDRVTLVPLPLKLSRVSLTTDRAELAASLRQVVGRAERSDAATSAASAANAQETTGREDRPPTRGERERGDVQEDAQPKLPVGPIAGGAGIGEPDLAAAGNGTIPGLRELVRSVGGLAGPKTVVLLSRGLTSEVRSSEISGLTAVAAAARASVYVLRLQPPGWQEAQLQTAGLGTVATDSGGTLLVAGRRPEDALARLSAELSVLHALTIEAVESDRDGRAHRLEVTSRRRGTVARARRQFVARDEPAEPAATWQAAPAPPPAARTSPAPATTDPARTEVKPGPAVSDPELAVVLARVLEYLTNYERVIASVVAEERYEQTVQPLLRAPGQVASTLSPIRRRREMRSDFLMVKSGESEGWLPFRDVFEVDGAPVRDREERLQKLFLEHPATAVDEARRITDESARYNIGSVQRNVNLPTLPLLFLRPIYRARFTVKRGGTDTVDGLRTWRLDFVEVARPTIIRGREKNDVPVSGSYWVDPASGRIVKTLVKSHVSMIDMQTTVVYRPNDMLGMWMPAEMSESYTRNIEVIEARAVYSNFRRFQVLTDQQLKIPK